MPEHGGSGSGSGSGSGTGTGGLPNNRCFPAAWGLMVAAKPCDYCHSASALLFCRTDSAFLCMACDAKMHPANKIGSRHERVWMCEVCEQAPATVTCKADAAALCVSCDRDIHSANPLARRHERIPVLPFYDTAESVVKSTAASFLVPPLANSDYNNNSATNNNTVNIPQAGQTDGSTKLGTCVEHDDYYVSDGGAAAWMSSNQKVQSDAQDIKSMEFLFSEPDNYLDFDYPVVVSSEARSFQHHYTSGTDGVVPVQTAISKLHFPPGNHNSSQKHFEIDFTKSSISSYNHSYTAPSLSQSVSSSSLEVGVVPDGSSMSEISYPLGQNLGSMDLSGASSGGSNQGSQMMGMDRKARVLRYREKRKNRKFEKTIRYASRKAYAETRPRIKGRFAKRTETMESDIDRIFSPGPAAFFPESGYGVVPSF